MSQIEDAESSGDGLNSRRAPRQAPRQGCFLCCRIGLLCHSYLCSFAVLASTIKDCTSPTSLTTLRLLPISSRKSFRQNTDLHWQKPLWNPYLLCGAPQVLVARPLAYLPGYAACLFDSARAQGFLILFHLLVAGIGGYIWFSRYGEESGVAGGSGDSETGISGTGTSGTGTSIGALVAAVTSPAALFGFMFMLCGYMLGSSINLSLLFSVCWTPLALTIMDRMSMNSKVSYTLTGALALILAQQFGAGRPEMFLGEGILYAAYALLKIAEVAPDGSGRKAAERFMLALAAAWACH